MSRRELILYATPTGDLGEACERYFAAASAVGPTEAQAYPPHCTLTGFFHRTAARSAEVAEEVRTLVADVGLPPADAVETLGLRTEPEWVGLELRSPWLLALVSRFVEIHVLSEGDDALRPKTWLHLSLAYAGGVDDLSAHAELAEKYPRLREGGTWEVALWERRPDGSWTVVS